MTTPVVRFRAVGLTYPGPPPVEALKPADLDVHRGEFVAVVGPSGSGKSTFLNVVGLLDRPTEGVYDLDGLDTATLTPGRRAAVRSRRLGFVFQSFHLLPHRTATETVAMAQLYTGVARRERTRTARHTLDRVGLSHRCDASPANLSGGERQRVAIARAIANRPSLLLCDEPTGNLDSATAAGVLELLAELSAEGATIVMITHDLQVAATAHRRVTIKDGLLEA